MEIPKYVVNAVIYEVDNDTWGFNDLESAKEKYNYILDNENIYDSVYVLKTIDKDFGIPICEFIR